MIKGFKAKIEAEEGHLLLGGVKIHTTAAFEEKRHAQQAAGIIFKENKAAGRFVIPSIKLFEVNYIEITADKVYENE